MRRSATSCGGKTVLHLLVAKQHETAETSTILVEASNSVVTPYRCPPLVTQGSITIWHPPGQCTRTSFCFAKNGTMGSSGRGSLECGRPEGTLPSNTIWVGPRIIWPLLFWPKNGSAASYQPGQLPPISTQIPSSPHLILRDSCWTERLSWPCENPPSRRHGPPTFLGPASMTGFGTQRGGMQEKVKVKEI